MPFGPSYLLARLQVFLVRFFHFNFFLPFFTRDCHTMLRFVAETRPGRSELAPAPYTRFALLKPMMPNSIGAGESIRLAPGWAAHTYSLKMLARVVLSHSIERLGALCGRLPAAGSRAMIQPRMRLRPEAIHDVTTDGFVGQDIVAPIPSACLYRYSPTSE